MSHLGKFVLRTRIFSVKCRLYPLQWFVKNYGNFVQNENSKFTGSFTCNDRKTFSTSSVTSKKYKTMREVKDELMKIFDIDKDYSVAQKDRSHLMKYLPKDQKDIPVRKMKESFNCAVLPLSSDIELKDRYVNFFGGVRIGRLMEDVDMFAVWCCVKHIIGSSEKDKPFPYIIVTILVDRIDMLKNTFQSFQDIRLSGHVCWVGRSSMEVVVWLHQEEQGTWREITRALLLMAARNPLNTGSAIVNALEAESEKEKEIVRGAEERKRRREQRQVTSILKKMPTDEELALVHSLFMNTLDSNEFFLEKRILPPNSKWTTQAYLNNFVFCHPEDRNYHNKIFGGFLMRQALELSWLNALIFGSTYPRLIRISDIGFFESIDVGSLVKLNSSVTFTEGEYVQIFVFAAVLKGQNLSEGRNTTSFNFTYQMGKRCETIYPVTFLDAMKYIDGRRHFFDDSESALPVSLIFTDDDLQ